MINEVVVLPEDQAEIRQAFREMLSKTVDETRLDQIAESGGFDDKLWSAFGELGGSLVGLDEAAGGPGGSMLDAAVIAGEVGRSLAPLPTWDVVPAARLAASIGDEQVVERLLGGAVASTAVQTGPAAPRLVPFGRVATVIVAADGSSIAALDAPVGEPVENLGSVPMSVHTADGGRTITVDPDAAARFRADRRVLGAAALVGAARRAVEDVVGYVKERHQFGRPIGKFQAIQHRLADVHAELLGAELLVLEAARAADGGDASAYARAAATAVEVAIRVARTAGLESSQFHGGYGFTLEYDVHRQVRFIRMWSSLLTPARGELLDLIAPADGRGLRYVSTDVIPDVPDPATWQEMEAFAAEYYTAAVRERIEKSHTERDDEYSEASGRAGLIGMTWPEYGSGASIDRQATYWTHAMYRGIPVDGQKLTETVANLLLRVGTPEQKERFLPKVVSGELQFSLGWSEAEAGSDTIAVRTRATPVEGGFIVQGAKMFTTMGHIADYVLLLCRTSGEHHTRDGLSLMLVPTDHDGYEAQEIKTFSGERTNSTYYNDVFVPIENLIGEQDRGFQAFMTAVNAERSLVCSRIGELWRVFDSLLDGLRDAHVELDEEHRRQLAEIRLQISAATAIASFGFEQIPQLDDPSVLASIAKLVLTETMRRICYDAMELLGPVGLVTTGETAVASTDVEVLFRHAHVVTIYSGASEVQKNVIARRGLGL